MRTVNATSEHSWPSGSGIHTGGVVVRGAPGELLTLGGTPTTAGRRACQDLAEPDTVVISEATRRLVERDFLCEPLGTHVLEGLAQPLAVYRLLQERPARQVWASRLSRED